MRKLHLTTPLMHGPDVLHLQNLLVKKGWLHDKPDGVYGVHTSQAVYRAQFWLGYLKPNHIAGPALVAYITGTRRRGSLMLALTKKRMLAQKLVAKRRGQLTKGQVALKAAITQLGETEHPAGSNQSKFTAWYGVIGAWCNMFVTWCYQGLGSSFKRGNRYAYVPYMRNDAVAGRNGLTVTTAPRSGDPIAFDWPGESRGTADHTGLYADESDLRRWAPQALLEAIHDFGRLGPGEFWTVEGNTAVGNDSNGGIVMIRKRNRSLVQSFIRVH